MNLVSDIPAGEMNVANQVILMRCYSLSITYNFVNVFQIYVDDLNAAINMHIYLFFILFFYSVLYVGIAFVRNLEAGGQSYNT